MNYTNADYSALAAAVAQLVADAPAAGLLVDTDNMCGAHFRHSAGQYQITFTHSEAVTGSFFQAAATLCSVSAEALYAACGDLREPFRRYLRRDKATDEPLPGMPVSCSQLDAVYENTYGPALQKLVQTLRTNCGENVPVILLGQLAAFYPAEHTVRKLVSFMPFVPVVDGLITAPALAVPTAGLLEQGRQWLTQQEEAKKRLKHTLMLQFKRLEGDQLTDYLHILAEKGTDLERLAEPRFSEPVLVNQKDTLILFADSTPFPVRLPGRLFLSRHEGRPSPAVHAKNATFQDFTTVVRFALGLSEGKPMLLAHSENANISVPLDDIIN